MLLPDIVSYRNGILLIELAGALVIAGYAAAAVASLLRTRDVAAARLLLADGVLTGLSIKLAAALLRTIVVQSWDEVLTFAAIFAIRQVLKRVFVWEAERRSPSWRALGREARIM